ncbi:MAG TPA: TetR/AcrR family transcriptional regulator [Candidatus Dormibacteraeota bacterium]|nr:TetR/AcrR family transcriptional regulator [Candidatus Dormibacteraeota bacterium]
MPVTRKYRMRARAEHQQDTRRRIVEAAVQLHGTVGPARTTFRGVAAIARLPRQTVYRHFADEAALFGACSAHYLQANPPPNPSSWLQAPNPLARLRRALLDLYSYYERNQAMLANVLRDAAIVPSLRAFIVPYDQFRAGALAVLAEGWPGDQDSLRASIGVALTFDTWRSLVVEQHLSDQRAVDLMAAFVRGFGGTGRSWRG